MRPYPAIITAFALTAEVQAWLLQFSKSSSCAEQNQIEEKGGIANEGNQCMMILPGHAAMTVTDWDANCRLLLWDKYGFTHCELGDGSVGPLLNVSLVEAKDQELAIFDETATKACFRKQVFDKEPVAASYICNTNGTSADPESSTSVSGQTRTSTTLRQTSQTGITQPKPNKPGKKPKPQQPPTEPEGDEGDDGGW